MSDPSDEKASLRLASAASALIEQSVLPVSVGDGSRFELLCVHPAGEWRQLLCWLPALGVPARHYLPLAEALAAHGFAVALHEWRGIGSSNRRAGRDCNWAYREVLLDDLPAALATVRQRWPQARCWIGGHSLGGQLGSLYASLHPQEHAGLVLVASGAPYWRRFRHGRLIKAAYAIAPLLASVVGHMPGRRIGFGGTDRRPHCSLDRRT
ncbi:MAG: alpha/beta fold hydrolase [Rhodanobacter sp.]